MFLFVNDNVFISLSISNAMTDKLSLMSECIVWKRKRILIYMADRLFYLTPTSTFSEFHALLFYVLNLKMIRIITEGIDHCVKQTSETF